MELVPGAVCKRIVGTRGLSALLVLCALGYMGRVQCVDRRFSAFFIFGDSLVDVGNNNYITTVAKASNLPFGIDFPGGPTGRFCNGKTTTDVLSEILGLPYPPPYLAPTTKGAAILKGVNYASAAAGIVGRTGYDFLGRVDMYTQLQWFTNTVKQLQDQLGENEAQRLLATSLFSITMGANDYVNNYLLTASFTPRQYTTVQFQDLLITTFEDQLRALYNLGARNVAVSSIGPIGCIPSQLARRSVNGECSDFVNNLALNFNAALKVLINQLNAELPGMNFVYAESFDGVMAYRTNPEKYGFKFGANACCGGGRFNGNVLCLPFIKPCPDRDDYVFWDAFHPTEAANKLLGTSLYNKLKNSFPSNL